MALFRFIVQAFACFEAFPIFNGEFFTLLYKAIDIHCINIGEDATGVRRILTDNSGCDISPTREMVKLS